jgi:hemerythrin-like domain-containing protein
LSGKQGLPMNVIEPLMEEHRVIKSTLAVFEVELEKIKEQQRIDPISVDMSIDFIRTYTDLVHHGKEENILFRELEKKNLSVEHAALMNELLAEHKYSRTIVGRWMDATERYFDGEDTSAEITGCLQELTIFYPRHIIKENKHFFVPVLEYFTQEEHNKMIREFEEFDDKILHWKYRKVESALQERLDNIHTGIAPR